MTIVTNPFSTLVKTPVTTVVCGTIDSTVAVAMTSMTSTYSDSAGPIPFVAMSGDDDDDDDESTDGVASLSCPATVVVVVSTPITTSTVDEVSGMHESSQSTDGVSSLSCPVGVVQIAGAVTVVVEQ
jgi:hypothetical protein